MPLRDSAKAGAKVNIICQLWFEIQIGMGRPVNVNRLMNVHVAEKQIELIFAEGAGHGVRDWKL